MEEAESETGSDAWKIKVDKRRTTHVLHLQKKVQDFRLQIAAKLLKLNFN